VVAPDHDRGASHDLPPAAATRPRLPARAVVVAGRRPAMLLSLKRVLEPDFEVAAMPDNVLSLLDALRDFAPDLLVMDTGSTEFGAPDLAWRLRRKAPLLRVLLVGDDAAQGAGQDPCTSYIAKHHAADQLVPAARELLGRRLCCDQHAGSIIDEPPRGSAAHL
jgi:DNA-binding NarL/FixJ family response regulator